MKIKSLLMLAAVAAASLTSCSNKGGADGQPTTSDSLQVALANQDSLLSLMNDITEGMNQIKQMENILSTGGLGAETPDQRQKIREDMEQIQRALELRRQRLEQLEQQLAASNSNNAELQRTIKSLKAQIATQEQSIEGLRTQLADANIQIEGLSSSVNRLTADNDSLAGVAAAETAARNEAEAQAAALTNEINTVYYAIGTGKELKDHNILTGGGLFKGAKVNTGDFDTTYFTKADKRNLKQISLNSKKAKLKTSQPADSYQIVEGANGMKVLKITNPTKFWNASPYLVVEI